MGASLPTANPFINPLTSTFASTFASLGNRPDYSPGSQLITTVNSKPNDSFTLCSIAVINARLGLNLLESHVLFSR